MKKIIALLLVANGLYALSDLESRLRALNSIIPEDVDFRSRILTTISCSDCDYIQKVEGAGKIFNYEGFSNYQLMHNGLKILQDCYYGKWMTIIIEILKGHHEPQEEKAFYEILKYLPENAVMIELGSYWGYYSMWFQQRIKGAQNYLIEPILENLKIGQKNFELNGMFGFFIHAAVGSNSRSHVPFPGKNAAKYFVDQVCIDDFSDMHKIPFIHMLHSDIQGAEVAMIKGCSKLIAQRRIGYFFVSTHGKTHEKCLKMLQDYGMQIVLSHTRAESFSADGLIVAKLPTLEGPSNLTVSRRTQEFCAMIDGVVGGKKSYGHGKDSVN